MGAKREPRSNDLKKNYYFINAEGKIAQRVPEKTETSYRKDNSSGQERHYEKFDSIEGQLRNIYVNTVTFNNKDVERLYIGIDEKETSERNYLEVDFSSSFAENVILRLLNLSDLALKGNITLRPYKMIKPDRDDETKTVTFRGVTVKDGSGEKIAMHEETRLKLPKVETITKRKGEVIYDRDDRLDFLNAEVLKLKARIDKIHGTDAASEEGEKRKGRKKETAE